MYEVKGEGWVRGWVDKELLLSFMKAGVNKVKGWARAGSENRTRRSYCRVLKECFVFLYAYICVCVCLERPSTQAFSLSHQLFPCETLSQQKTLDCKEDTSYCLSDGTVDANLPPPPPISRLQVLKSLTYTSLVRQKRPSLFTLHFSCVPCGLPSARARAHIPGPFVTGTPKIIQKRDENKKNKTKQKSRGKTDLVCG